MDLSEALNDCLLPPRCIIWLTWYWPINGDHGAIEASDPTSSDFIRMLEPKIKAMIFAKIVDFERLAIQESKSTQTDAYQTNIEAVFFVEMRIRISPILTITAGLPSSSAYMTLRPVHPQVIQSRCSHLSYFSSNSRNLPLLPSLYYTAGQKLSTLTRFYPCT